MCSCEQIKKIYESMADDLSKKIFYNRLLYSLTGDYTFMKNVIEDSYPAKEFQPRLDARAKDAPIVVYGAGEMGDWFFNMFKTSKIAAVCDSQEEKWGALYHGYNIISPMVLRAEYFDSAIVVAVLCDSVTAEITKQLLNMGFRKEKIIAFTELINYKEDEHLAWIRETYFPSDVHIPLSGNEVFIDAGCYDFDSSLQFIKECGGEYKKIIAFEPSPNQYPICVERSEGVNNATIYPYGLWHENTELAFDSSDENGMAAHISDDPTIKIRIKTVKLDDILAGEEATYIKMDIEGAELNALKGARETILKYHPKLAVSMYHKPEDIWEIPSCILDIRSDYDLYMRHFTTADYETVLYALPKNTVV